MTNVSEQAYCKWYTPSLIVINVYNQFNRDKIIGDYVAGISLQGQLNVGQNYSEVYKEQI